MVYSKCPSLIAPTTFDTINKEYKSVDNYLTKALGVTPNMRKTLQSLYLQG
ncbi:tyrosine-protein phosphatase [Colwellia sp. 20A7]|uniref:tyrosine-protein phosphatase n=1 Tax=Colwellia sp. 20A7 TaxID=2689569 RepID=UPI00135CAF73